MDSERAGKELAIIRQLMERPVRYSTTSGLSGVLAGAAALAGLALDWRISCRRDLDPHAAMWLCMAVWGGVFAVAFAGVTILTRLRERRRNMPFWSPVKRRILRTIGPPFVAGVGLTGAIVYRWYAGQEPNQWGLIPSIWMVCHGLACWQVGEFSIRELRAMGAAFILTGLVAAAWWQFDPYWTVGLSFGGYHLLYGAVVWRRYGG
ncbi:MAG: hypothetical protein GX591_18750 [Planctomycetes bacterium]|nr:hypothetical protein [Planctomycetota bacterium]